MKKHLFNRLSIILLAMIGTFPFTSCSDDEAPDPDRGQIIDPDADVDDPTGTVSLAMRNRDNGNTRLEYIYIDDGNNFSGSYSYFASIGKVRGLGNVSDIPTSGWASQVAVNPGYGYVAYGGDNQFYRIYVEDYIVSTGGGIIGADIKYQTPFKGRDEAISLDQKSLTFTSEGGSQALVFKNKGIVLFDCESSADWCRVQKSTTYDQSFLYNGVTITVKPGQSTTEEEATVTLTTAYGKETEIKVTRAGAEPFIKFASGETKQVDATKRTYAEAITTSYQPSDLQASSDATWCEVSLQDNSRALAQDAAAITYVDGEAVTRASSGEMDVISCNVMLSVKATDITKERQCNVTVKSKDGKTSSTLAVIQTGASFSISSTSPRVTAQEGTWSTRYSSSLTASELTVKSNVTWCTATIDDPNKGYIYLSYEDNPSSESRDAIISITSNADNNTVGTITLTQSGGTFTISNEEIWFDKNSGNKTISINTTLSELPEISSSASWCTVSTNDKNLTIRVTAATQERTATISFSGQNETIKVTQSKYAVGDEYDENGVTGTVVLMDEGQRLIAKEVGSAVWSTENVVTGANDNSDGTINTDKIKKIPHWATLYPAFALCDALNTGGITGWYLPASYELYYSTLRTTDSWSSTEYNSDKAYISSTNRRNKNQECVVYAFRKF